jgi:hypothetical protein
VEDTKAYAEFGIPGPAPCPSWSTVDHASASWEPDIGPGRAEVYHGGVGIGGTVLVGEGLVSVGLGWRERFAGGAWQSPRGKDLPVFLQSGTEAITFEATERNMAGLAAIARLISPEAEDRAWQLAPLAEATLGTWSAAAQ